MLPNSEVVTNVALGVDLGRLRSLSFAIALDASVSNSISIAVGAASGEGMSPEEADFEWGYDCGKWFCAYTSTGGGENGPRRKQAASNVCCLSGRPTSIRSGTACAL